MRLILNKETADKKLRRMALEVAERNQGKERLHLIGIRENGIHIARKIADYLTGFYSGLIIVHELSMDKKSPAEISISESVDFSGETILLVDDVANSGRTMLYALKPLLQYKPVQIQTLALVERTHKLFPIAIDYIGLSISTTSQEHIAVEVKLGEIEAAYIQ